MMPVFQLLKVEKLLGEVSGLLMQLGLYALSGDCCEVAIDVDRIIKELEKEIDSK